MARDLRCKRRKKGTRTRPSNGNADALNEGEWRRTAASPAIAAEAVEANIAKKYFLIPTVLLTLMFTA